MEKYLVSKNSIHNLIFSLLFLSTPISAFALAGRQVENDQKTSSELVVRHMLDMQQPPFINLTPSRPTIVQFPSEVSNCVVKSDLINITYGNGEGISQNSSASSGLSSSDSKLQSGANTQNFSSGSSSGSNAIYSSVTLSVKTNDKFTYEDLLNTPETYMICSIRTAPSDSFCEGYNESQSAYCYVTVGVKVSDPTYYNAIVYLDKPGSVSSLPPLPERRKHFISNNLNSKETVNDLELDPPTDKKPHLKNENIKPLLLPKREENKKPVLVKKSDKKIDSDFKITPLPRNYFKQDESLGLQADNTQAK